MQKLFWVPIVENDMEEIDQSVEEVETETPETENVQPEGELETPEIDSEEEDSEESELSDVEYEGKQYKLPKELRDALLRQSDYTRKTQEVSEQRRQLETVHQQFQESVKAQQANLQAYAQLTALDQQLGQYEKVDFQQWSDTDPIEAQKAYMTFNQLRSMRDNLAQNITAREQQAAFHKQQELAKQLEEGQRVLQREIKGWSPEYANELFTYAASQGYPEAELRQVYSPLHVKTLHKAYLYDKLMAKSSKQPKDTVEVKPTTKVGKGSTGASKNPDQMTTEEWMKWRNSQVKRRA